MRNATAPALVGSVILHLGLAALALWRWPHRPVDLSASAVSVTLVSAAKAQAPRPAPAVTPEPEAPPPPEEAKAEPEPPAEAPPPPPAVSPKPAPPPKDKGLKPEKPTPAKAAKPSPTPSLDLDALAASLAKPSRAPAKPAAAAPAKPSGAPTPGPTAAMAGAALKGLTDKVTRNWVLNCEVPGTRDVVAHVRFTLSSEGRVIVGPTLLDSGGSTVFAGAAEAAVRAIKAGAPYSRDEVPAEYLNQPITMRFFARDACAGR